MISIVLVIASGLHLVRLLMDNRLTLDFLDKLKIANILNIK